MSVPGRLRPWSWGAWLRSQLLPAWPLLEATCLQPLGGTRPEKQPSVGRPTGPCQLWLVEGVVSSQAGMHSLFSAIVIRSRHCGISYKVPITKFPLQSSQVTKFPSFKVYNYKIPNWYKVHTVESSRLHCFQVIMPKFCSPSYDYEIFIRRYDNTPGITVRHTVIYYDDGTLLRNYF